MKYLLPLFVLLLLTSCLERKEEASDSKEWDLPSTPIFSNSSYWAVVADPYLKVFRYRDNKEDLITTCRRGDILEVKERHFGNNNEDIWLKVLYKDEEGWVSGSSLMLFDNQEQAETASAGL